MFFIYNVLEHFYRNNVKLIRTIKLTGSGKVLFLTVIALMGYSTLSTGQSINLHQDHLLQQERNNIRKTDCVLPSSILLDEAIQQSKNLLRRHRCFYQFDTVFERLKQAGTGNPGEQNKSHFAEFLNWSKKRGIITKKQASNLYNRYFGEVFISLPERGNICSHSAKNQQFRNNLDKELIQKKEGMISILGDNKKFNSIYKQYTELAFVLDMAEQACRTI